MNMELAGCARSSGSIHDGQNARETTLRIISPETFRNG